MALSVWETADGRILCTGILPYRAVRHLPTHMLISKKENVMKKVLICFCSAVALTANAFALEVPSETAVQVLHARL